MSHLTEVELGGERIYCTVGLEMSVDPPEGPGICGQGEKKLNGPS